MGKAPLSLVTLRFAQAKVGEEPAFIRGLGPAGKPEPAYPLPHVEPSGPVVRFP